MASKLEIVNYALVIIGLSPLQALDDGSAKADTVSAIYAGLTEQLLGEHEWTFTKALVQLSQSTETPPTRWLYKFELPAGTSSILAAYTGDSIDAPMVSKFEIMNDGLYANVPAVWALYQYAPEIDRWSPTFTAVVRHALAAAFASALTDDDSKHDKHYAIAFGTPGEGRRGGLMGRAITQDSRQETPQVIEDFSLIAVRS